MEPTIPLSDIQRLTVDGSHDKILWLTGNITGYGQTQSVWYLKSAPLVLHLLLSGILWDLHPCCI